MRKLSTKFLITAFFLLGISQITKAQVSLYDFIRSTGMYTELTGATVLATATATTGTTSLDDNNYTLANGTIPFNFTYDGVVYTGCTVSTNGYITLGATAPTTTSYTPLSATTAYAGAISAVGGNLNAYFVTGNAAQTGSISYQTLGVTPNRKFVIQYKNFKPLAQSGTTFSTAMNFQIVLNETSNAIDVIYNFTTGTYTAGSYQVGLRGANNTYPTSIKNRSVVTGTNTWATSINGTANTSTCGVSTTLLPASGLTFRYAPTSCPSPTSLSAAPITSSGATLTWTNPITGGTFTVEYGPAGFTPGTGTIATTTTNSLSISGLLSQTTYSYYVQKSCGTGNNSLNVGPYSFTTGGPGEDCSTAPTLTIASSLATCSYTTVSTGISINGPTSFCSDINGNQATNDKWFKFVAPANGKKLVITTQAGTNNDWVMEVWTGCPGGTAYQFKCGDDNVIVNGQQTAMPEISMCQNEYVAGQTYYVRVWTYMPFAVGTMDICVYETTMCPVAPNNDNCANAIRLTVNPPLSCATNTQTFLNNYATRNTDAATCDASLLKGDVWFVFNTGSFSDVDLTINAITAVNVKAQLLFECGGVEVSCWNPGTGTKSITGLNPQADYILRVWTDSTSAGTFSICITDRCSNPSATTSGSYTTCTGNAVSIPVTFTGTAPFSLTYTNGTTSSTLTGIATASYNLIVTPSATSTYTLTSMSDATCVGSASGSAAVTVITPQNVTLNAFSPICDNAPLQQLSGGSPSGGLYSGVGVSNGFFNPAFGSQTITYTVTYTVGCTRSASQIYTVNPLPTVAFASLSPVCNTLASFLLTGGSPIGGSYVGPGVSNNTFNPATVGPGTYVITYYYTTAAGCTANDTSTIVVTNCSVCTNAPTANAGTDKSICYNTNASIAATIGGSASSQTWSGGTGAYAPNNTSLNITYTPSSSEIAASFARLILTTNDPDGNGPCVAATDTMIVNIISIPIVGNVAGSTSLCRNQSGVVYSVVAQTGAIYQWTVPIGVTITAGQGTNSITTTWGATAVSGNVGISLTNSCGTTPGSLAVTVGTSPTSPTITGSAAVCLNQTGVVYSIIAQTGATYTWTAPTGVTITAGQGTNSITTTWGATAVSGTVGVSVTNTCGTTPGSLSVTVGTAPTTPTITGSAAVCLNQTGVVYSITAQTGATYQWTAPTGVTITAGQGTNSITTTWSATAVSGNVGISLTNSCGTRSGSLAVTVGTSPTTPSVTGSSSVCRNQTGVIYSVTAQAGVTYTWTAPTGVTITAGQGTNSITTTWGATAVSGNVGISLTSSCGTTPGSLAVTVGTSPTTPSVSGSSSVCRNQTGVIYSVTAQAGVTYTWTAPTGVTITAGQGTNSITTTWGATAVSGTVVVSVTNTCGTTPGSTSVTVGTTPTTPTITGSAAVCLNQTGVVYSVTAQAGATYTWTVPTGVTITAGQGTNSITTSWGATAVSGNLYVSVTNTCGTTPGSISVTVGTSPTSPTITGSAAVCLNQTGVVYSVTAQAGTTYTWTVPTGVTITAGQGTNSITTTWTSTAVAGAGYVSVALANSCGSASGQLAVVISAATTLSSITGNTSICLPQNQLIYSVTNQTGVTYTWTVPSGVTILSGQGTNQIITSWSTAAVSGNISVVASGICNNASSSLPVVVSSGVLAVGAITGNTSNCKNTTGIVYSISAITGATYTWSVPVGVTITAGQGTASITTSWTATAVAGNVSVTANTTCSSGSSNLAVGISSGLVVGAISGNSPICRPATGVVYSVVAQVGVTYVWTVPTGVTVTAGAGTSSITTTWSSTSVTGSIKVVGTSACGKDSTTRTITVRTAVPTQPVAVTGATTACIGDALKYSITKLATADYYVWTPKTGMLVNGSATALTTTDTAVTVTFTTGFVGDTLKVNGGNCKGLSTVRTKVITKNTAAPTTPGTLTGQTTGVCGGVYTYSFATAVTNATSYTWRTKNGTALLNGQAATSITLAAPNQSLTITYPASFVTDTLFVKSNNGCGSSAERAVLITAKPATPGTITTPTTLCIGTTLTQVFSIAAVTGATSYTWTYPATGTTYVSGQGTTSLNLRFTATGAKSITVKASNACGISSAKSVSVSPTAACPTARDGSAYDLSGIVVYPNPTRGNITVAFISNDNSDYDLVVLDMSGRVVEKQNVSSLEGYNQKELNLESLVKGTYIISLKGAGLVTQTRLIIE